MFRPGRKPGIGPPGFSQQSTASTPIPLYTGRGIGAGCCCCLIAEDKFNRTDGPPGGAWVARDGIWATAPADEATISGNVLRFLKPGVMKFATPHPEGVGANQHIQVKFKLTETTPGDGCLAMFIVGYANDGAYLIATVDSNNSCGNAGLLRLWKADAASGNGYWTGLTIVASIPLKGFTFAEWHTMDLCLLVNQYGAYSDGDYLRAKVTLADGSIWGCQGLAVSYTTGAYVALGNAYVDFGTGPSDNQQYGKVEFDDFKFTYFRGTGHAGCPNCNGPCAIYSDDFNSYGDTAQDASGRLTCYWRNTTYLTTAARILTSRLECENGSLVRCELPHPTNKQAKIVTVDVKWEAGIKAKVSVGSGYAIVDSTARTLTAYDSAGGQLSQATGLPVSDDTLRNLEVCLEGTAITATFAGSCVDGIGAVSTDPYVYFGSAGGTVHFDNFVFKKLRDTDEPKDSDCDECASCKGTCTYCYGIGTNAPVIFKIVLAGFANGHCTDCSLMNGTWYRSRLSNEGDIACFNLYSNVNCCGWGEGGGASLCAGGGVETGGGAVYIYSNFIEVYVAITNHTASPFAPDIVIFRKDFSPALPHCLELVAVDLPLISAGGTAPTTCTYSGVTCTISTV